MGDGFAWDFFVSRRGSVAAVAREVADALAPRYEVKVQDYDIPLGASFVAEMHDSVKNARALIVLLTKDYEGSPYTRKEFTAFEAERLADEHNRFIVILRCEDIPPRGLMADHVFQDLVGVADPAERQRRILAAANREPSAQRPARPRQIFAGLPPRIAGFTGRAAELDAIDAALASGGRAAVTQVLRAAVQGLGGVGKTSLAIEYAHRYRPFYDGVWWSRAASRADLLTSLANLATELGLATDADVEKAAKAALRRLGESDAKWLLVYDNVASPDEIRDLLPGGDARLLITSRFSDWSDFAEEISLDVLPLGEAMAFLQARAGHVDTAGAEKLAEALGRLPLALDHAAAYCKRTQMSFAAYAAKATALIEDLPRGTSYPRSVAATFRLAIDDAVTLRPAAEPLMAFLAHCAPDRIPLDLVEGALDDEDELRAALGALVELSLVRAEPFEDGTPAVTVHRLVQAVGRARAEARGTAEEAVGRVIGRLGAIYPRDRDPWSLLGCGGLTLQLVAICASHAVPAEANKVLVRLLRDAAFRVNSGGILANDQNSQIRARALFERALSICEIAHGPEHPEVAILLIDFALLLRSQGNLKGARSLLVRALAISEKALGPEHPATGLILSDFAGLLQARGDVASARSLFERALAIVEKALGYDDPATRAVQADLARLLYAQPFWSTLLKRIVP